jgi:hypothetical protein
MLARRRRRCRHPGSHFWAACAGAQHFAGSPLHPHLQALFPPSASPRPALRCHHSPGDHQIIAKETSRQLGLGTNIPDAANLPTMDADGKIPKDLGKNYGKMILESDGFAQVSHV